MQKKYFFTNFKTKVSEDEVNIKITSRKPNYTLSVSS